MVRVPRYGDQQVRTAPLPNVRANPNVPQGALGGPALPDLSGVARAGSELAIRSIDRADQIALLEADNQLATLETDLRTSATQLRGKDALGATAKAREGWEQRTSEIEAGLTTERQKLAFRQRVLLRGQNLYETTERHASVELERVDKAETEAAQINRVNDAIQNAPDPAKRDHAIAELRAITTDHARRNGLPPEVAQAMTAEWVSRAHVGVLNRMLAAGGDRLAADYYATVKGEIAGSDQAQVEKALEVGSVLGESQRQADAIMRDPAVTRAQAFETARQITDPKVRQETEQRLDIEFRRRDQADADAYKQLTEAAYGQLVQTGRVSAPLMARLKPREITAIRSYQRSLAARQEPETDWKTYYTLKTAAADPAQRADFLDTNLIGVRHKLSDTEFKELVGLQAGLRKGEVDPGLKGFMTEGQVVENALPETVKRNSTEAARFRSAVDEEARDWKRAHDKKEIPTDELRKITAGVLARKVFVEGRLFGDDERPAFGQDAVREDEKGRAFVPLAQIPEIERAALLRAFNAARVAPTLKQLERAYAAHLRNDRALFDAIVSGEQK